MSESEFIQQSYHIILVPLRCRVHVPDVDDARDAEADVTTWLSKDGNKIPAP